MFVDIYDVSKSWIPLALLLIIILSDKFKLIVYVKLWHFTEASAPLVLYLL